MPRFAGPQSGKGFLLLDGIPERLRIFFMVTRLVAGLACAIQAIRYTGVYRQC
jgi:hypothetical protein